MTVLADGFVRVDAILAFENLTTPDKKGKYGGKWLVPKSATQDIADLTAIQQAAATTGGVPFFPKFTPGNPHYDGDVYRDSKGQPVPAFAGYWLLNARSGFPIVLLDENNAELNPVDVPAHKQKIYSGVGCQVVVNAFAYPSKDGGQPGAAFGCAAVKITDTTKPRIAEGGSGGLTADKAASLFGGSPAPQQTVTAPNPNPAPAPDFLQPPAPAVKTLIPTQAWTIEQLRANGFSDEQMVNQGYAKWSA